MEKKSTEKLVPSKGKESMDSTFSRERMDDPLIMRVGVVIGEQSRGDDRGRKKEDHLYLPS